MSNKISQKKHIITIFITILFDMIGVGIIIPLIPFLFDIDSSFNVVSSNSFINANNILIFQGIALAIFPLFQFLFAPILGELSDHYGRRKIMLICITGTMIGHTLTAYSIFTHNLFLFLIGRVIDGATAANISVAMASISDVSKEEEKAKNFGLVGAAFGLGLIIGPAIGGLLSANFKPWTPFIFATFLSILNIISIKYFVKETYHKNKEKINIHIFKAFHNIKEAILDLKSRKVFLLSFLFSSGFAFYTSMIGVYYRERFHLNSEYFSYFLIYSGLMMVFVQMFILRKVFSKYKKEKIIKYSLLNFVICLLIVILSQNIMINIAIELFMAASVAFLMAGINSTVSSIADEYNQGKILGINTSIQSLSTAISQGVSGTIAAISIYYFPLFVSIIFFVLAALTITKIEKSLKTNQAL